MEGKKVSPFSATQIGAVENAGLRNVIRSQFREESKHVLDHLKGTHHTRKLGHMQTCYPSTVNQLESTQKGANFQYTSTSAAVAPERHGKEYGTVIMKQQEFVSKLNSTSKQESGFNSNRRLYNRDVGQKAQVSQVAKDLFKFNYS